MKTKYFTKIMILALLVSVFSCDTDDESEVLNDKDTAGVLISVSTSSGALLGSPESGVPIEDATVTFTEVGMTFNLLQTSGSMDGVSKLEVVKIYNGDLNQGKTEVTVAETTTLPYTFSLTTIDEFLAGSGVTEDQLRIGDNFVFRVKIHQTDGDVYYYHNPMGRYALTVNCASDLNGIYTVTNSVCGPGTTNGGIPPVAITQNSDGTWYAETADGGLLQFCTSNNIPNPGSFAIGCGGVVDASGTSGGPDYCTYSGGAIGCITGGSWNQDTGVLQLEHQDDFFGVGAYTSTYVRN
ncbi:hypothetical protein DI383_06035 [Flavobacteriaceae bacterium LYZ1037]|nr:hypothetical protein DI383_06035 [Flavobacteriaceae bacterium LYZ1037]